MDYDLIDEILEAKGISRIRLASLAGINVNNLSSWFRRKQQHVPLKDLKKIANVLDVSLVSLLGERDREILQAVLLKEQEPVKPKKDDAWPYPIWVCGVCGTCLFKVGDYKPNFCSECGRAVKWDAAD